MKKTLLFIVSCLLVLQGCDKSESDRPDNPDEVAIEFEMGITPVQKVATDMDTYTSTFEVGDAIGLFAVKRASSATATLQASGNYLHNVKLTFDGTKWNTATPIYYPNDGDVLDFYAYYPYNVANTDPTDIQYDLTIYNIYNPNALIKHSDWMTARAQNKAISKNPVQLSFQHKMAMVHIKLDREVNVRHFYHSYASISIFNIQTEGTLNLSATNQANEFTTDAASIQPQRTIWRAQSYLEPDTCTFTLYMPPQTIPSGKLFCFDNTDDQFYYNTTAKTFAARSVTPFNATIGWGIDPDHVYAIGDVYPHVGPPIGIVYEVTNGGKNGKVLHPSERTSQWGPLGSTVGTNNFINGKGNLTVWRASSIGNIDVFNNLDIANGYSRTLIEWYLPAALEMSELHNAWLANQAVLDAAVVAIGGTPLSANIYWSSTEDMTNPSNKAITRDFSTSASANSDKDMTFRNRWILEF